jgi:hypothetical protein
MPIWQIRTQCPILIRETVLKVNLANEEKRRKRRSAVPQAHACLTKKMKNKYIKLIHNLSLKFKN